jgi:anthranilate synthase/aminodeoxychorismate synthase-like glutamine amidotransferase
VIVLIDNYDSFVHNLARYFRELGETIRVVRNDCIDSIGVLALEPTHIVISPGPCTPASAGVSTDLVRALGSRVPVLGVCLGHQCIGEAYGGRVVRAIRPMHGKISAIDHDASGLLTGVPSPVNVTRYHSLVLEPSSLPAELTVTAWTDDGEVMAVRHAEHPVWGVQFHPEAVCTRYGHAMLANFLALGRGNQPPGREAGPTTRDPSSGQFSALMPATSGNR